METANIHPKIMMKNSITAVNINKDKKPDQAKHRLIQSRISKMNNPSLSIIKNAAKEQFTLTVRQFAIMALIYNDGIEDSVDRYADALKLKKPVITKAINRLENIHLVKRGKHSFDARKIKLIKTELGNQYMKAIGAIH